jgi:hypothetical protein
MHVINFILAALIASTTFAAPAPSKLRTAAAITGAAVGAVSGAIAGAVRAPVAAS